MIINKNLEVIKNKLSNLTDMPGVYLMRDGEGNIIYIGKAKNLKNRVSSYFNNSKKADKVLKMVENVSIFDYIVTNTEIDALNLESNLIKQHQPFFNINLKFGKNHPFLKIDIKNNLPVLSIIRKIKPDKAKYFGPFFGGVSLREVLTVIETAFFNTDDVVKDDIDSPYKRTALNVFMGKQKNTKKLLISRENYMREVDNVVNFLNGDLEFAKSIVKDKMIKHSEMENFENAIKYRDCMLVIDKLKNRVVTELTSNKNIDIIGFATNGLTSVVSVLVIRAGKMVGANNFLLVDGGIDSTDIVDDFILQYYPTSSIIPHEIICEHIVDDNISNWLNTKTDSKVTVVSPKRGIKHELQKMANNNATEYLNKNIDFSKKEWDNTYGAMQLLKDTLKLKHLPKRIEGYDISNMQGNNIVASMVVFIDGKPQKSHYRRFKINSVVGKNNDFDSMKEVLERRLSELNNKDISFSQTPDLILIDGGKGQLSSALQSFNKYNVDSDIISLAKQQEEIFLPNRPDSILLKKSNVALKLLQKVRDESHRFAITFHRSLRNKNTFVSELSGIEGVGEKTIKKLLIHFKGINGIRLAGYDDLKSVGNISDTQIKNIINYFTEKNTI